MKVIVWTKYGSQNVLQLKEVEKPVPKDNEVLVRIDAAIVTPSDCYYRKGEPDFSIGRTSLSSGSAYFIIFNT